jgi:RHS repeat-associated protein
VEGLREFCRASHGENRDTYDAASNRTSLTAPDGSTNSYNYDTLNRLTTLTNSLTGQFGFGYDALSRRTQLTRPNGVNTNYNYDSVSHLLSVLHQAGSTTLDGASYGYDFAGNRTSKTNYLNGITSNYGYDAIYELLQVTQGGSTTESYSYDAVGNRLSSSGVPTYSYNSSNELTSNSSGSYTYDANGNTLSDASGRQYTWDFENRLVQAVVPGTGTTTFKYDPFGRRIQKSGPLGVTNYLYDGINAVEEVDSAGNVLARYAQGLGFDQPLSEFRGGTTSYYQQDGLNSVTSLTSPAGALANSYTFDSFGKLTASSGTLTNPFQYTGRELDSETGLYFNRARYFDLATGRWLSEDPLQFAAGMNFYEYSYNNPANFNDPSGLQAAPVPVPPPPTFTVITGGGGAAAGGGAGLLTGGLITLDLGLLTYDSYETYQLGIAYGWWQPFLDSGNMQQVHNPARAKCQSGCQPCVPPVGSLRHRVDQVPPSRPHKPWTGTHWHIEQMQQAPAPACTCFWKEIANGQGPVPPGVPHQ